MCKDHIGLIGLPYVISRAKYHPFWGRNTQSVFKMKVVAYSNEAKYDISFTCFGFWKKMIGIFIHVHHIYDQWCSQVHYLCNVETKDRLKL